MQFKLTSPFRFWSTFGPVQNPFKDRSYFRPPSQMVFLGVCRSALFFVCPSGCLSQSEADCGLWQVAPSPPLTSFKPSYRLPLPSQQNIPALSTKSCCFFKCILFLQRFVYIGVLFLLHLAKVKIDGPLLENSLPSQPCQRLRMRISLFIQQALYSQK